MSAATPRGLGSGSLQITMIALVAILLTALPISNLQAAGAVATITHATGTAHLRLPDGSLRLASAGTEVPEGTIVSVEDSSSVRIIFPDGAELVLRPGSRLRIDALNFVPEDPESDKLAFSLIKGGLRAFTGLIGRRGPPDAFEGRTLVGSIGIRGTEFGMILCAPGECEHLLDQLPAELQDRFAAGGLFFEPTLGVIAFRNATGEYQVTVGQWGYAESMDLPPIIVADGTPFPLRDLLPLISSSESIGGFSAGLGVDPFAQCWLQ